MNDIHEVFSDYPDNKFAKKIDWWTSPEGIELISGWRKEGYTLANLCEKMGIDKRTFRVWRKKCPQLEDALLIGKEISDKRVINSLYQRATGYNYDEITQELVEGKMRVTKIVTKHVPPDVRACLAYLYNRCSKDWRAIQEPVDVDTPALLAVDDMLAIIRDTSERASVVSSLDSDEVKVVSDGGNN